MCKLRRRTQRPVVSLLPLCRFCFLLGQPSNLLYSSLDHSLWIFVCFYLFIFNYFTWLAGSTAIVVSGSDDCKALPVREMACPRACLLSFAFSSFCLLLVLLVGSLVSASGENSSFQFAIFPHDTARSLHQIPSA